MSTAQLWEDWFLPGLQRCCLKLSWWKIMLSRLATLRHFIDYCLESVQLREDLGCIQLLIWQKELIIIQIGILNPDSVMHLASVSWHYIVFSDSHYMLWKMMEYCLYCVTKGHLVKVVFWKNGLLELLSSYPWLHACHDCYPVFSSVVQMCATIQFMLVNDSWSFILSNYTSLKKWFNL